MKSLQSLLSDYIISQHDKKLKLLTPQQMRGPWTWHYKMTTQMADNKIIENYMLTGVTIPEDGEARSFYVDASELRFGA
jgi:hypothetical protein